jgi:glyoxylase-like metal-dependent hydrolase (beta-lactamase superfamily II)
MQLHSFTAGPFKENTYLLVEQDEALLVDPGFAEPSEFTAFQQELGDKQAELKAVLLTHAHVDHLLGLPNVLEVYDVPVYLNDADRYLWHNFAPQSEMFGFRSENFGFEPEELPAQKDWKIGSFRFDVLFTPGHAPAHVSLYSKEDQFIIAGDALFKEGIGRTDLYKGDIELLTQSIRKKLYTLPDETIVYSGHGPSTTIGHEKAHNPFVQL